MLLTTSRTLDAEAAARHIEDWMSDYIERSGLDGWVVGVSGGIDSAVTSTLAARTGRPTVVLRMPIHQAEDQDRRGANHIAWLTSTYANVTALAVDLTSSFDGLSAALEQASGAPYGSLSLANARARLRMTTLYAVAAERKALVAGTGNKVEDFGVGFYTKYGDGGVDLSPIADLVKSEVYAVGRVLGVGEAILNAAPTDGLWGDNRTDEDQLGATYDELEWAMEQTAAGRTSSDFGQDSREAAVLEIYLRHHRANRHKMDPIPVCEIPASLFS
jgi:NAD+ synthase